MGYAVIASIVLLGVIAFTVWTLRKQVSRREAEEKKKKESKGKGDGSDK